MMDLWFYHSLVPEYYVQLGRVEEKFIVFVLFNFLSALPLLNPLYCRVG